MPVRLTASEALALRMTSLLLFPGAGSNRENPALVAAFDACGTLELDDHWIQRTVAVMRRALEAQAQVRLAAHFFGEARHQSRFANTGFARDENDLAAPVPGHLFAIEQMPDFLLPADK